MANKYFLDGDGGQNRSIDGESIVRPAISTVLDSVRAYQWEVTFDFPGGTGSDEIAGIKKPMTLGAKQVNGLGFNVEDIEVNRVNDKVYYPGRVSYEEAVITFDNIHGAKLDKLLYEVMSKTFDPRTGVLGSVGNPLGAGVGDVKGEIQLVQLKNDGTPRNVVRLINAYPKALTHGEYNYSTNEFHTLEMTFRYDYFVNTVDATGAVNAEVQ
jgi:hypothetical protein